MQKKAILSETRELLGDKFDAKHFTPNYEPWDQRLCLSPDGDFFDAITAGKASIVTDHIQEITETGVSLESGQQLDADMIISATGLEMQFAGGIKLSIDGKLQDLSKNFIYKGFMCDGIPNLFMSIGYTNASWTLKVDLTNRYSCRLINHMDKKNYRSAVPEVSEGLTEIPLLDLSSGYIQRATHLLPKQASQAPWSLHQNFLKDKFALNFGSMKDSAMKFHP